MIPTLRETVSRTAHKVPATSAASLVGEPSGFFRIELQLPGVCLPRGLVCSCWIIFGDWTAVQEDQTHPKKLLLNRSAHPTSHPNNFSLSPPLLRWGWTLVKSRLQKVFAYSCVSHSLSLWVPVFLAICCRRKVLWWWLNKAFTYEYRGPSLGVIFKLIHLIFFNF